MNQEFEEMFHRCITDLDSLAGKWTARFQEGLDRHIDSLMRDAFDPERFMDFLRSTGADFSALSGASFSQPPFDPYRVLGLDRSASDGEVKKRYREMLYRLHPDTAGVDGTSMLLQIVMAAYQAIGRERGWQ